MALHLACLFSLGDNERLSRSPVPGSLNRLHYSSVCSIALASRSDIFWGMQELVNLKTRVTKATAARLEKLAHRNERSIAAEMRLAIAAHLSEAPGKDGRK